MMKAHLVGLRRLEMGWTELMVRWRMVRLEVRRMRLRLMGL